ncbi:Rossman fold protein, TIGR00730 family [Flavobacterium cyanobacteriorum]|uniref:Cytokinin riboside 5'-monophosphate phosphoribohydrolase n=1 Tax=Flavobacterium cyanobacteriorum TaxID=2022802 RepID=A0A255ZCA2_9FLAO|nr:TIGR00730 family Rossman fold protein [Flavobacterium cyanobacteriorum]OYQ38505.1 Rossman fold protein, TIGR00730 family [Flavobacterium cyanobacteriorum]
MQTITVFCASSHGNDPLFQKEAYTTGYTLAKNNIGVVYGGACVGLMGAVADGALAAGGQVTGVLPHFLQTKEIAHTGLTRLIIVNTMHERKLEMHGLSDGIITLPGGFGTLEELFEMLTWAQLGLHKKPVGLLNVSGFYNSLLAFIDEAVQKGLLKQDNRDMILVDENMDRLLEKMRNYKAPETPKWITKETT